MKSLTKLKFFINIIRRVLGQPRRYYQVVKDAESLIRGENYAIDWTNAQNATTVTSNQAINPLETYFQNHKHGRGIWKWEHYFEIYHRHFQKFIGKKVHILEIGIYSGGSLEMWRQYFGPQSKIFGVDIEPACSVYENEYTTIAIGDQADPAFWQKFKRNNPVIDILIDDGGHTTAQQITTLEEMLPHLRPGGVYICEDIHGEKNPFSSYMHGLAKQLHQIRNGKIPYTGFILPFEFQNWIHSIHFYPYLTVIEKAARPRIWLVTKKQGTEWQPFYDDRKRSR